MVCSAHPPISPLLKICFLPFQESRKLRGFNLEMTGLITLRGWWPCTTGVGSSADCDACGEEAPKSGVTTVLVEVEKNIRNAVGREWLLNYFGQ